jgi:hypothetical protein
MTYQAASPASQINSAANFVILNFRIRSNIPDGVQPATLDGIGPPHET